MYFLDSFIYRVRMLNQRTHASFPDANIVRHMAAATAMVTSRHLVLTRAILQETKPEPQVNPAAIIPIPDPQIVLHTRATPEAILPHIPTRAATRQKEAPRNHTRAE